MCLLRKAIIYRLKGWGTINTKRCSASFISKLKPKQH